MWAVSQNGFSAAKEKMKTFFQKDAPKIAAHTLKPRIIRRTTEGVDASGRRFSKYSPAYLRYGRLTRGLSARVDLTVTGEMKNSLDYYDDIVTQDGRGHALAVSAEVNARAVGNQSLRTWIGLHPSDEPAVNAAIVDALNVLNAL